MKRRSTYRLLVQSEERNKNVMEIAVYALVALSCLISIWPICGATQPALPFGQGWNSARVSQVEVPNGLRKTRAI